VLLLTLLLLLLLVVSTLLPPRRPASLLLVAVSLLLLPAVCASALRLPCGGKSATPRGTALATAVPVLSHMDRRE
jgi:hypothetical protein